MITSLRLWLAEEIHKDPSESRSVSDPDRLVPSLVMKAQQLGLKAGSAGSSNVSDDTVLGIMP